MRIIIEWPEASPTPTKVYISRKKGALPEEKIAEAVQMYYDGKPMSQIEKFLHRSRSSVKDMLRRYVPSEDRRKGSATNGRNRNDSA